MSLRDIILFAVLAILVVRVPLHPYIGALAWVVFGVMNPNRLSWGPAYTFPFSYVIAILTLIGLALTKDHRQFKGGAPVFALLAFFLWCCVTTPFAFESEPAIRYLIDRVLKVFLMTGVLLLLFHTRRHVDLLVWMLVISLGFYGTKGGIFVIATGGSYMVNGPEDTAMAGNNSLGVGLVVVIPLMVYLYQQSRSRWVRWGLLGAAGLCSVSVLGSYSRGALLAIAAMGLLLWWRSSNKLAIFIGALLFALIAVPAMPERWTERMNTIKTYEEDTSAMGRIYAWETAYNIAKDKFPLAGGFEWESPAASERYSPEPTIVLVAHSIYFQVLGSQGFIGLTLFLIFWALVWRQCAWIRRVSQDQHELQWAHSLASMVQVSLIGYFVGGAFLDIAFWDLAYYLFVAVAVTRFVVKGVLSGAAKDSSPAPAPLAGGSAKQAMLR